MAHLEDVRELLDIKDRLKLGGLLVSMILAAALEVAGIGLLFPFVALLQDPALVGGNRFLSSLYWAGDFSSNRAFGLAMGGLLIAVFLVKGAATILINNAQLRFVYFKHQELGRKVLASYLGRPYSYFLNANTSTLIGNLTTSISQVTNGVLQSALALISEVAVLAGLVVILMALGSSAAVLALVFYGALCLAFVKLIKSRVARYAKQNDERWKAMIRTVNESLSGVKEIQVLGREAYFVEAYSREAVHFGDAIRKYTVLSQVPRVVLETSAVVGMVVLASFALLSRSLERELLPVLALFAVATVRLVPSANRILQSWHGIKFYQPAVAIIAEALREGTRLSGEGDRGEKELKLQSALNIRVDRFSYGASGEFSLRDIDISVLRGTSVAFIGRSGSGKTTLVDIVLSLLPGFEGEVSVDGQDVRGNERSWRKAIGYIPQVIFLADDTIARNVAFGVPDAELSAHRVRAAVSLAGLDSVVRALPDGLDTIVGDRGIRLSGGERQRIGIARALYHDPDVLILDEATSALDNETEGRIVDSILGLTPAKTILVIAHRLSTVKRCDRVYLLSGGKIVDEGPFEDLAARHPDFVNPRAGEAK